MGILYVVLVLLPTNIYYMLTTGSNLSVAAPIISLIFFLELFKFSEKPLTKQEAFIIYAIASEAVMGSVALALMGNLYFRSSPMAEYFGISDIIPDWWAPSPNSPAVRYRTFFHGDWLFPILVLFSAWTLGKVIDFSLATYLYHQFVEIEKLPFPLANVSAETVLSLTSPQPSKKRVFTITSIIGIVYGIVVYALPLATDYRVSVIPVPFYDLTHYIEDVMPGASLGISTDLVSYTFAFFMPHSFIVFLTASSFFTYFIANNILVQNGLFPLYMKGMGLGEIYTWSYISYWMGPIIGFSIAIALSQIVFYRKYILSAVREFTSKKETPGEELVRSRLGMYAFFTSTTLASLLAWALTGFNPYYLLLIFSVSVVWSFLFSHLQGRALAEYGFGFEIPYFVPVIMYLSGARSPRLWFVQTAGFTVYTGGVGVLQQLKVATLCETKPRSYIKAWFFTWFLGAIMGILFLQVFWTMAPIPSSAYPASMINFPVQAAEQYLLISAVTGVGGSGIISLNIENLATGFVIGVLVSVMAVIFKLSPSLVGVGLLAGTRTWISTAMAFAMSIIVAKLLERRMGKTWWEENRFVMVAGIYAGIGLSIGLGVIALFLKKAIISPYY